MPELPDVEGFRRVLSVHAVGRKIRRVDVLDTGVLRGVSADRLRQTLTGRRFGRPWRHGKHLVVPIAGSDSVVLLHLGMTGALHWSSDRHRHDRVVFVFGSGELAYRDMRKLHGLRLARDEADVRRVVAGLGPDALDLTRAELREQLAGLRRQVKPALVDQAVIAGLGNLLADEILWRAYVHPRRPCTDLDADDFARIHARMRTVLRQAIPQGRVPPRKTWLTGRRDEKSGSCPRCGTTLNHGRVGGRGTAWCPRCQPD
ncbi:Fpg/Nei family DNA glycosylase [Kribbella sp. CA-247076]|uniref:Fpg/Nei family DNA glycosylase n=1 Tax=Kribbella sp. CA-247076 TaxID=3239941 RepID=UPI003D933BF6